jgi:N-carbamoyl-L-amino-acid hydrolase
VLAALETVRVLNDQGLATRRPIEVINFSAEESSRFGVATLGSKAMIGAINPEDLDRLVDEDGISLRQALLDAGCVAGDMESVRAARGDVYAFLELHIEQGPVLERERLPVGIVTAIAAPTRLKVVVTGRADHSGTTPMNTRKDALACASEVVLGVERIAGREAGENTVGTVGYLRVAPGVMNVVPERVEMGIDLRDIGREDKKEAASKIIDLMTEVAERRKLVIEWETLSDEDPVPLSDRLIDILARTAEDAGMPYLKIPSGAGHDAMNLAKITDAGMIFIPSLGGISHNVAEKSRFEDICRGTELLVRAVFALAQE